MYLASCLTSCKSLQIYQVSLLTLMVSVSLSVTGYRFLIMLACFIKRTKKETHDINIIVAFYNNWCKDVLGQLSDIVMIVPKPKH